MKVKNLISTPVLLGDGRLIGASGTTDAVRDYGSDKFTEQDKTRVQSGDLLILTDTETKEQKPTEATSKKEKN